MMFYATKLLQISVVILTYRPSEGEDSVITDKVALSIVIDVSMYRKILTLC